MTRRKHHHVVRASLSLLLVGCALASGCASLSSAGPEPDSPVAVEHEPLEPATSRAASRTSAPVLNEPTPAPARPRVIVIRDGNASAFREVTDALSERLGPQFETVNFSLETPGATDLIAEMAEDSLAVVAVGFAAAEHAVDTLPIPVVFAQVFAYEHLIAERDDVHGVAAIPPLDLQLANWQRVAPGVSAVGMLVSDERADLIEAARDATRAAGIELHAQFVASDREALYRFKRLAPNVDGLWLFPDNAILSPRAIREVLDYALKHNVHTIVFNPTLLDWGALLSVSSVPRDVADAIARTVEELVAGGEISGGSVRPLTVLEVELNEPVALSLGLVPPGSRAQTR